MKLSVSISESDKSMGRRNQSSRVERRGHSLGGTRMTLPSGRSGGLTTGNVDIKLSRGQKKFESPQPRDQNSIHENERDYQGSL